MEQNYLISILSQETLVETDLSYGLGERNAFIASGIYQWLWNIDGGLDWYAGLGSVRYVGIK